MTPVESSNIAAIGFEPTGDDKGTLTVQFRNGTSYAYGDVPTAKHTELMEAESVGRHFNANIRGEYEVKKIEPEPQEEAATEEATEESK